MFPLLFVRSLEDAQSVLPFTTPSLLQYLDPDSEFYLAHKYLLQVTTITPGVSIIPHQQTPEERLHTLVVSGGYIARTKLRSAIEDESLDPDSPKVEESLEFYLSSSIETGLSQSRCWYLDEYCQVYTYAEKMRMRISQDLFEGPFTPEEAMRYLAELELTKEDIVL